MSSVDASEASSRSAARPPVAARPIEIRAVAPFPASDRPPRQLDAAPRDLVLEFKPGRRPITSVSILRDDKEIFDIQASWWSMRAGRALSQYEVFSRFIDAAVTNPAADVAPREFLRGKAS